MRRQTIEAYDLGADRWLSVFTNFSLQHLPRDAFGVALREVRRVLRPGGLFELAMHNAEHPDGVRSNDDTPVGRWFTYWVIDDLLDTLDEVGFRDPVVEDDGFANRVRTRRDD